MCLPYLLALFTAVAQIRLILSYKKASSQWQGRCPLLTQVSLHP